MLAVASCGGFERPGGVVVEDRGPIALNGSQIVAIRLDYAPDAQFEVRAEELERVAA